jgi:transcriptional regulator GlxA family with amidase domain
VVQKWIERMANEPDADFDIDEMANDAKLAPQRFRSVFKDATGLPVHAYLMLCRMEGAKELVRSRPNMSLLAVSQRFRFSSAPHFAASFKRIAGTTFMEYVKSLAKEKA